MDRVDHAIKDFVTGKLDTKIQALRLWLARRVPAENIGGGKVRNTTAPQEILVIKWDEDEELNYLESQKSMIELWWSCESAETKRIILLKYRDELSWFQISQQLYISERTLQNRYYDFRNTLQSYIG